MAAADHAQPRPPTHNGEGLHTYGPQCRLAPVPQPEPEAWLEGIPPSNAQFFYASPIPVDDPLSAPGGDAGVPKLPLRPFSQGDNNALEAAWLQLSTEADRENHRAARGGRDPPPSVAAWNEETLSLLVRHLAARHRLQHALDGVATADAVTTVRTTLQGAGAPSNVPLCCDQLPVDAAVELAALFCPRVTAEATAVGADKVVQRVLLALARSRAASFVSSRSGSAPASYVPPRGDQPGLSRGNDSVASRHGDAQDPPPAPAVAGAAAAQPMPAALPLPIRPPTTDDGISGKPFLRVGDATPSGSLPQESILASSLSRFGRDGSSNETAPVPGLPACGPASPSLPAQERPPGPDEGLQVDDAALRADIQATRLLLEARKRSAEVAVGIARLHTVELPSLRMNPIYWSPVNDVAVVQRATWFYRDTMMPLEAAVANQLEAHYRELRPWSETWAIELRCAIDLGPVGEEKVSQPLWPKPIPRGRGGRAATTPPEPELSSDLFCASRCHHGAAAAGGALEAQATATPDKPTTDAPSAAAPATAAAARGFANYHVVFKDGTAAFLLKPSLTPSAYYGRRPIAKISKGATVGIPIVRGFDRDAWGRIHERAAREGKTGNSNTAAAPVPNNAADGDGHGHGPSDCPGCSAEKAKNQVTDLVLVVHGVGQKLAERVESFHFTHAVNGLRRAMNAELRNPIVQSVLREGQNGVMVLPVNWRHTLSFENGGFAEEEPSPGRPSAAHAAFGLKDIEPATIPAVRGMISDVMFDIPFYMSHHKPKMIQSLVREANRVYRLWCRNNPGFAERGRVHLIGHSLGSAMAAEVLSKQPTVLPPVDPASVPSETATFAFDTKNLFLLGSPAAFFLLLERGALVPRRGRQKPGLGAHDSLDSAVVGGEGAFGCLAVDNIYNILAKEDPIAYLLNGTIDRAYAASLKTAYVPSASLGFFAALGHSLQGVVSGAPGASAAPGTAQGPFNQPPSPPSIARLPSQLELDVHDFTREEIAERKAFLLNDNGQIDYFLRSGGGPLEIQYLNMLSAHTSYWTNRDLIRMLCVEIGRRPGREYTLPAMRARKAQKRHIPSTVHT